MAENGTLWLDYPSVGGPSPDVPVSISGKNPQWFRRHPSRIEGDGLKWVAASGVKGLEGVTIVLADKPGKVHPYTVRLYFSECENRQTGGRVFDVAIQGRRVLKDFDILSEAGLPYRTVEKEFKDIQVSTALTVTFAPGDPARNGEPIICGIEVVAQGW